MVPWKVLWVIVLLIFCLSMAKISNAAGGPQKPIGLRCEYLANPIGVDVRQPRFCWVLEHSERGQKQTAYQILVSTQPACEKSDMWDSEKVSSVESTQIIYKGKPLASDKSYYWRVRYWDKDENLGPYSEIATFDTGLISKEDWNGTWIGGANQLRKEFQVNGRVVRAHAFICGLGYSELRLNGRKVGANVLDPGWTTYDKRALYVGYDVTNMIQQGANAAGVLLGKGWYKSTALLFQLNIQLADGQTIRVVSDSLWKSKNGPIVEDSIYNGEIYDARLEMPGWDRPGYDDKSWKPVEGIQGPKGVLSAQMMPPIRVVDTIVPLKMANPKPGVYVFDMGQNTSGWARLRVSGPAGAVVKMRFAEMLYDDGMLNQENLRAARAEDTYILKGEGEETYEPRFTYHGFRYVEVTGFPGVPNAETIRGRVVHSSVKQAGSFACSKPVLNSLQRIITWGQKTNLHSIPTDCNQRDERMGWMGDAQGTAEEAMMNFDMAAFYTNFIRDIRDVQDDAGTITDTVPHIWGSRPADPAWGTAYPLLCWYMYQYYGDKRILEEQYDGLKKYVEFLRSKTENGLLKYSYYGDWVAVEKTPGSIVSSFYYYYDVKILGDIAKILGIEKDAQAYAKLAEGIKATFHSEYFDPKTKNYANGTQTANTLALFLELAPKNERGEAWGNLFDNLVYKNNSHLTTGIIGTKYIMELLTRFDNSDLAYDIATQTTYPSWGYMIENGATTLWELWQLRQGPSMNSHNHPMFGSVGAWLYKALAGITVDPTAVAFEKIRIEPQMVRDLFYASGSIDTLRGRVLSSWSRTEKSVCMEVAIPVGSEAEVILPKFNLKSVVVKESGKTLWAQKKLEPGIPGIMNVTESAQAVILKIGSGRYSFELSGE
jgi:alpha-L-rhamnosidase